MKISTCIIKFLLISVLLQAPCFKGTAQNFFSKFHESIRIAVKQNVESKNWHQIKKGALKDSILLNQQEIIVSNFQPLISSELQELEYVLLYQKEIKRMIYPLQIIVNFSAPTLIKPIDATQCSEIQMAILDNVISNWKQVLLTKSRLSKIRDKALAHNNFTTKYHELLDELLITCDKISPELGIGINKIVDTSDKAERKTHLKRIAKVNQQIVDLWNLANDCSEICQDKVKIYISDLKNSSL